VSNLSGHGKLGHDTHGSHKADDQPYQGSRFGEARYEKGNDGVGVGECGSHMEKRTVQHSMAHIVTGHTACTCFAFLLNAAPHLKRLSSAVCLSQGFLSDHWPFVRSGT